MNPESWAPWGALLGGMGYPVLAPAWPYDDRPVAELQKAPDARLAAVGVPEIVAHYEAIIRTLVTPPILIGHSFGGLFVQMLLDRGLGACGVAIDPAPPKGVFPSITAFRAALPIVTTPRAGKKVLTMSFDDFAWGWVHTLPEAEQRSVYERYCVPTPGLPYTQGAAAPFTDVMKLDFANPARPPLLLIAGAKDRTVTADMVKATYKRQRKSSSRTDFKEFPDRTHWIIGQEGWEEVARYAIGWCREVLGAAPG